MSYEILVAHYNAVREEEMERIRQREQYIQYLLLSVAAVASFSVINSQPLVAAVIPFLVAGFSLIYSHADATIGSLTSWLGTSCRQNVGEHLAKGNFPEAVQWDGSQANLSYYSGKIFILRYALIAAICVASNALGWLLIDTVGTQLAASSAARVPSSTAVTQLQMPAGSTEILSWVFVGSSLVSVGRILICWIIRRAQASEVKTFVQTYIDSTSIAVLDSPSLSHESTS
ncbi:MAG: hypothetical protein ACOH2H_18160 [Cypionkella sp.]